VSLPAHAPLPAAPDKTRPPGAAAGVLVVAVQLALVAAVIRLFDVAGRAHFFPVFCLAGVGFLVHAALPARFRTVFFCALSVGGILLVLGAQNGLALLAVATGLILACRLDVPLAWRAGVVAAAGLGLAAQRLEEDYAFWPVLGSMFMFRLVGYLFDQRHAAARPPLPLTVAYFLPLPNASFLFFPILDFKTFRDTYRPSAGWESAQAGVGWVALGLSHVLLYRAIKYYILPSPFDLADAPHLMLFLAANYALYLHVSGYFHVITGMFHLFGFELPRTHHNYFLASSVTDIWRRINIPWKEFMTKVFFYPAFFAARGWGNGIAVVAAAAAVFVATWLLHAYQVFWITGSLPLHLSDAVLWLGVGAAVAVNLLLDLRRASRPRPPGPVVWAALRRSAGVVGTFVLVSVFWACWNTPPFLGYARAQLASGDARWAVGWGWVVGGLVALVAAGTVLQLVGHVLARSNVSVPRPTPLRSAAACTLGLTAGVMAGLPRVGDSFGPSTARVLASLRGEAVTPVEAAQAVQGYYEAIADAPVRTGSWLAALEGRPAPPAGNRYPDMSRPADALLEREPIPDWAGEVAGAHLTLNRFGMRDRSDRDERKPPGTVRIAVLGSSVVMGYGVGDTETCTRLLEDRLNAGHAGRPRYEVLNFGAGRSTPISRRVLLDRKVFAFDPDAVYWVAHQDELLTPTRHLARILAGGSDLKDYPCLGETVRRSGITPETSPGLWDPRLQPHARELVLCLYREAVAECRRRGILPVFLYLPMPGVADVAGESPDVVRLADRAGFLTVDLSDWAGGRAVSEIGVEGDYFHVNALGHRLVADRLEEVLRRRPELLPKGGR